MLTAHGALMHHLMDADPDRFQPMNVSYGLFPPLPDGRLRKREKHARLSERALEALAPLAQRAEALLE